MVHYCIIVTSPLTISTVLGLRDYYHPNYMIGKIESQRAGLALIESGSRAWSPNHYMRADN